MTSSRVFSRLEAKRQEQVPQALARLVVVALFVALWGVLYVARLPMPVPFLAVLLLESGFFVVYLRVVPRFSSVRSIGVAQNVMLAAEILFHTTMVYFLGGLSWLGAFAYVFGLIFSNTFLDLRRGFVYTTGASLAFSSLILLEATGTIPHYVYLEQGPDRFTETQFVATTLIGGMGVFYSIYLWVNWVGFQLRQERDAAVRAQDGLLEARSDLQRANEELEQRVRQRTLELETANASLRDIKRENELVLNSAGEGIYGIDLEGRATFVNPAAASIIGWEVSELLGRPLHETLHHSREDGSPYPDHECPIYAAFRDGTVRTVSDEVFWRKDGQAFPVEYISTPIRDEQGALVGAVVTFNDITERRHAEAALRESEERYRSLAENSFDLICEADAEARFSYLSPNYEEVLGYAPEELLGSSIFDLIHEDDRPAVVQEFVRAVSTNTPGQAAFRFQHKNREWRWFESAGRAFESESGELRVAIISRDITQRRRAEQDLRESEERFRKIFDESPIGMAIVGADLSTVRASQSLCRMLGYSEEELTALTFVDITHPDDVDVDVALAHRLLAGEIPSYKIDKRYVRKDGTILWGTLTASLIRTPEGTPIYGIGMVEDISERKRAEEALRQSDATLRGTIESTGDGILVLNEEVQVVHVNENFFNLWRMPEELRTTHSLDIYRDFVFSQLKDPEAFRSSLRDVFRTPAEGFDTLELTDGRVFESYSRPLLRDGDTEGRVFSVRDVTQRRLAEETLRESESKFRTMAEAVAVAVLIYQGTKMRYVNSAAEELTGYAREELLAMDFWEVIHPEYRELVRERGMARQRGADVPTRYELKIKTKNGVTKWVEFTASMIDYEGKAGVLGTAFDITDRKRAEEALREHANRDPLTGLLNRRAGLAALDERLRSARNEGRTFAVLVLDLDKFKSINDTFSHETGDNALLQFAQVMSDLVGNKGIAARLGGDEFEIGLDGFDAEEARAFADLLQAELRQLHDGAAGDDAARFTVSIGIACSPDHASTLLQLGRLADKAMYEAKSAGGDRTRTATRPSEGRAA